MKPIDIVITFHIKDEKNLKYTVNSIRQFVQFSNIYIVTKIENYEIVDNLNCKFINENIIGSDLCKEILNEKRGGWYLQQILKLYAFNFVTTQNYLVIDADTVILKNLVFIQNNKPLYLINYHVFEPYFKGINYLLGIDNELDFSFISHHMIFDKEIVKQLIYEIELYTKTNWINAILNILYKNDKNISFSEFETYGNFLLNKNVEITYRKLHTIDIPIKPNIFLIKLYSYKYDMISFHNYSWASNSVFYRIIKTIKYFFLFFR